MRCEICFRSFILPAKQAGEVQKKEKMDNVGSNLSFSVVVVVIVWGIIWGVICVKGNCFFQRLIFFFNKDRLTR